MLLSHLNRLFRIAMGVGVCLIKCLFESCEISRLDCLVCNIETVKQYNMLRIYEWDHVKKEFEDCDNTVGQ